MNSVQTATTSGPAHGGDRAQLEVEGDGDERHRAHGHEHRHERQQRADEAAQPHGEEGAHEEEGQVGERASATSSRFWSRPTPTTAMPPGATVIPGGAG